MYVCIYMYVRIHIDMYVCIYIYLCMYICMYVYICPAYIYKHQETTSIF